MRLFTLLYLLLLAYIIAAMTFWGFSLEKQSVIIYEQQREALIEHLDSISSPEAYKHAFRYLEERKNARSKQYLYEGITSILVILTGAAVVYTSFRRSMLLSRQQHNFMLSVTHELKSPIAAMKLNLQTLEKYDLDEHNRHQLLERSIAELNRLNELCNNMLVASQMEGRQYITANEQLNLSILTEEAVDAYSQRFPNRFQMDIIPDIFFVGDQLLFRMAINNLLENTIKYSPKDTVAVVSLQKEANNIVLKVADRGAGIPDEEKKRIFGKFYRIGNEETRATKGTGLGLYLTRIIVRQHKGQIRVYDNKPSGTVFEILLPA